MRKQILNIGKALNKVEQQQINGGLLFIGRTDCQEGEGQSLSECEATCGVQGQCIPCGQNQYRCDYANSD